MLSRLFGRRQKPPVKRHVPTTPKEVAAVDLNNHPRYREAVEKLAELQSRERQAAEAYYAACRDPSGPSATEAAAAVLDGADVATLPATQIGAPLKDRLYKQLTVLQRAVELQRQRLKSIRGELSRELAQTLRPFFVELYAEALIYSKRAAYLADQIQESLDHLALHGVELSTAVRAMPLAPWLSLVHSSGFHSWLTEMSNYEPEVLERAHEMEQELAAELAAEQEQEVLNAS